MVLSASFAHFQRCKRCAMLHVLIIGLFSSLLTRVACQFEGSGWGNVALSKSAFQSSVNTETIGGTPYTGESWRAVDGNKATLFQDGSCMSTERDWDPWWLVDLGQVHMIKYVEITSRNHSAQKLQNFTIEMSQYMVGDPSLGELVNPVLCIYHPPAQRRDTTKIYPCYQPIMGRYVKIMRLNNGNTQPLYFCEVEIYGSLTERFYEASGRPGKRSRNPVVEKFPVQSTVRCSSVCRKSPSCTSFNVESTSLPVKTCELVADPVKWVFDNEADETDWTHYVIHV